MAYSLDDANAFLHRLAEFARQLNFQLTYIDDGHLEAILPYQDMLVRDIGMICGQSILATADSLGPIAVASKAGGYREMVTSGLNCQFFRALPAGDTRIVAQALKVGQRLSLVQLDFYADEAGTHGAMATVTYVHL